jgi:hypothetical protein
MAVVLVYSIRSLMIELMLLRLLQQLQIQILFLMTLVQKKQRMAFRVSSRIHELGRLGFLQVILQPAISILLVERNLEIS